MNHDDTYTVTIEGISNEGIKGTFWATLRNMAGQAIIVGYGSFNLSFEEIVNP